MKFQIITLVAFVSLVGCHSAQVEEEETYQIETSYIQKNGHMKNLVKTC
ncbi:hypothetical protein Bealeia1_01031 [Candidatus Bealeia paramacronuclearis]|uniref:Uncharacterized protein n=1 Tax=Candidatus Bealeia paramacronuclearis TaxID=1921001 RepID=A0ABZ2C456_9PROT|nr:hypothetical protein [Candidatus Bealeia paramacronuclearis]